MEEKYLECDLLIRSIARKFYNVESEDLYQAGCLGLIKAYNNYTNTEVPFSSFAYKYIFGEMYDLYTKSRNIKMNKNYLSMYKLIIKTQEYLTNKLKRNITDQELSEYLNISYYDICNIRIMSEETLSLDETLNIGKIDNIDFLIDLEDSIDSLDKLSSLVMYYRINYDLTQSEIAKLLGISQVKVSRIESNSKSKILEYIS
jgi:RNA polymerase sporulation-specific sigma factor